MRKRKRDREQKTIWERVYHMKGVQNAGRNEDTVYNHHADPGEEEEAQRDVLLFRILRYLYRFFLRVPNFSKRFHIYLIWQCFQNVLLLCALFPYIL